MKGQFLTSINEYDRPAEEPIHIWLFFPEDFVVQETRQYLYLYVSHDTEQYDDLPAFTAAAFYNFCEDAGTLDRWPGIAEDGLYRQMDEQEFSREMAALFSRLTKTPHIDTQGIAEAVLIFDDRDLWAAAGRTATQYIAVFLERTKQT